MSVAVIVATPKIKGYLLIGIKSVHIWKESRYKMDINITKTTKIAVHQVNTSNYSYNKVFIGANPFGPKGGTCGRVVDASLLWRFTYRADWGDKATYAIHTYMKIFRALNLEKGTLTDNMKFEIEKTCRKRTLSKRNCAAYVCRYFKKEDLPLAINEVPEIKYYLYGE